MRLLKLFLSLTAIFTLGACDSNLQETKENSGEYRHFYDRATAQARFESAFIRCGDDGECPESAVGVFTLELDSFSSKMGGCSGTLIAPDQVLTNEHCLPEEINEVGASCHGMIRLAFAETGTRPQEVVDCERVVQVSDARDKTATLRPDWAILKLQRPVQRHFRALNRVDGIQVAESVKLYKINIDINLPQPMGFIQETSCLANTHHYLSREHIGPLSQVFNISNCNKKLIIGNSGTGVLNQAGEVVGVFSFNVPVEDGSLVNEDGTPTTIARLRHRFPKMTQNTGGGTQMACIPYQNQPIPSLCEFNEEYHDRAYHFRNLLAQRFHPDFALFKQDIQRALLSEDPPYIQWDSWEPELENGLMFNESMSSQQIFLARYELSNLFPWMPRCVEPTAPEKFSVQWYKRTILNAESGTVDNEEPWRRTLANQMLNTELFFEKAGNQSYVVHFNEFSSDQVKVTLELPLCNN